MTKRMLILSASVGAGHVRAAQAIELAAKQLLPDATVQNIDVLTLTNTAFRRVYGSAYLDLVNKAPHVLGYFYDRLDRRPSPRRKNDRLWEGITAGRYPAFLQTPPDAPPSSPPGRRL